MIRRAALLLAALIALVAAASFFALVKVYRMPSSSMEPTLHCAKPAPGCRGGRSDRFVVLRYVLRSPARGDLVAFRAPRRAADVCGVAGTFVKRVIGLPGETVTSRSGRIRADGRPLREPYLGSRDTRSGTWRVPAGRYFLLGDNRAQSCDSRSFGAVPRGRLVGRVLAVYWPPNRLSIR